MNLGLNLILLFIGCISIYASQLEELDRGLVAVVVPDSGVFISWRLLASDPDNTKFNIYKNSSRLNDEEILSSTNFLDREGNVTDLYYVKPVVDGIEKEASKEILPWDTNYKTVPLQIPSGGQTPDGNNYTYSANDASAGDLDGDGEYDIILKWDPSNAKDNAHDGYTGNVILDGIKMDGTLLWRIDLGINVRAGAHYNPFMVYDLNGDGIAEIVCRTASGSRDATGEYIKSGPASSVDHSVDYRNSSGRILTGPEFLTVFNGSDGTEMVTINLEPDRGFVGDWGDTYGNRVDRFLAAVVDLGDDNPSVVWARGTYTKIELVAYDLVDDELVLRWHFNSNEGYNNWSGMGSHNLSVADVDGDNKDEIIYGHCAIDDDGTGLWTLRDKISTPYSFTGDAMHVADILPERPGLERWACGEGNTSPGAQLVDAATGEVLWLTGDADVGRATAGDLVEDYYGMECWGGTDGLRSAKNEYVGPSPSSTNHVVWWDGDLGRELLNATDIRKYGGGTLLVANGCSSNNGSKSNPCLQADLLGDWREEVIWRTSDNSNLRIYTTTHISDYRFKTLMHDWQYRNAIAWQNVAYNQPPHTSFFLGYGMFTPDSLRPPARPRNIGALAWKDTVKLVWNVNTDLDLSGYRVYRGSNAENLSLLSDVGTDTTYLDTDVTNDSSYFYAITAYDLDNNESKYSDIIEAIPTIRPDIPTGISFRHDDNFVMILWDSLNTNFIKNYNIYRSEMADMSSPTSTEVEYGNNSFIDIYTLSGRTYYYTLSVTDTNNIESFQSNIIQITPKPSFTFQSEHANILGSLFIENNHLGFYGTGFANFDANNSELEFTNMPGFGGGTRTLIYRYALGNDNRTGSLTINGNAQSLTMEGTGDWTNYVQDSVEVELNDSFNNLIKFAATGSDFGNLDEITIVPRSITDISSEDKILPTENRLFQNYPNPFNPTTVINYQISEKSDVAVSIFDILGQKVEELVNKEQSPGNYQVVWNATDLTSGVYFYHLKTSDFTDTKKLILMR